MPTNRQKKIHKRLMGYRNDPCSFFTEVLSLKPEYVWSKMREIAEAVRDHQFVAVRAGHSVSKALAVETPILTTKGFKPILDVHVGDKVFNESGNATEVTVESPVQTEPCYEVIFDDGSRVIAHAGHLWNVHDYVTRKRVRRGTKVQHYGWRQTKTVTTEWMCDNLKHGKQNNLSIPVCYSIENGETIPFPYTLGFWLGDGTRTTSKITIGDQDADHVLEKIRDEGFEVRLVPSQKQENCNAYCVVGLRTKLKELGVCTDKHIPEKFIFAKKDQKIKLLQGYMDADGFRLAHGRSAALGTTDKRLYDSVIPFVASFGVKVFTQIEKRDYCGREIAVYKFNFSPNFQPFTLARKCLRNSSNRRRNTNRTILNVRFVGERKVKCISVASKKKLFLCTHHMIPTHNTFTTGRLVAWYKTCFLPSTVITTAPSENQVKNQLWREIRASFVGAKVPLGGSLHTTSWDMKPSKEVLAKLSNEERENWEKNFAMGFSTTPDSASENATKIAGFHNTHVLVCLDEAGGIHPIIWNTVMEGLISDENCKVLAIGNPTDPESEFYRVCYSDTEDMESGKTYTSDAGFHVITISCMDTPNYKTGKRLIPGLAGRDYVERMEKRLGKDSDKFRYRVKGLFPTFKEGTYYGQLMAKAEKEGRVGEFPHDPTAKVHTFSDYGDRWTGTLYVQFLRGRIRIIDEYWDNEGQGLPAWVNACNCKDYTYGDHFGGPDLRGSNAKSFQTGRTTVDIAASLGFDLQSVIKHSFNDGLEATRGIFSLIQINKDKCPQTIAALKGYGKKKNEALSSPDQPVYHDQPAKTWHRHLADAVRHLAMAYRYMTLEEQYLGDVAPSATYYEHTLNKRDDYNPLQRQSYDPLGRR